jgi:hypothetical protein
MKTAKIFLSHSSKDKEFVRKLANDLSKNEIPIWFDDWELKVGDSLNQKISEGINESGWLAAVISNNSVTSSWVAKELNAGLAIELEKKQVYVLPLLIDNCEIPMFLKDKMFADFRKDYQIGLNALLKRLIPEHVKTKINFRDKTPNIQRQPTLHDLKESLLSIKDVKIEGRDTQYIGLFNVRFILDKTPDHEWEQLFEHPTMFSLSVHPAKVRGSSIIWQASEDDIKRNKHWIYEWVDDANKRYIPIIEKRNIIAEQRFRNTQLEYVKVAELESLLKIGREETLIKMTDEVIVGKCSLRLDGCSAPNMPGPITQIDFENQGFIHTCFECLNKQIDEGKWKII